jgi:hypothetical protein
MISARICAICEKKRCPIIQKTLLKGSVTEKAINVGLK